MASFSKRQPGSKESLNAVLVICSIRIMRNGKKHEEKNAHQRSAPTGAGVNKINRAKLIHRLYDALIKMRSTILLGENPSRSKTARDKHNVAPIRVPVRQKKDFSRFKPVSTPVVLGVTGHPDGHPTM